MSISLIKTGSSFAGSTAQMVDLLKEVTAIVGDPMEGIKRVFIVTESLPGEITIHSSCLRPTTTAEALGILQIAANNMMHGIDS